MSLVHRAVAAGLVVTLGAPVAGCRGQAGSGDADANVYVVTPGGSAPDAPGEAQRNPGPQQVDRAGRPLVSVLLVGQALQDDYNVASAFDAPLSRTLTDALAARLHALDTMRLGDGAPDPVDWAFDAGNGSGDGVVAMLANDALLVDTSLPCTSPDGGLASTYLDLEREIFLGGSPHRTCGGRTPGDGVVDTTLTLLVTGGRAPVTQGVAGPTQPSTTTFPYLANPN